MYKVHSTIVLRNRRRAGYKKAFDKIFRQDRSVHWSRNDRIVSCLFRPRHRGVNSSQWTETAGQIVAYQGLSQIVEAITHMCIYHNRTSRLVPHPFYQTVDQTRALERCERLVRTKAPRLTTRKDHARHVGQVLLIKSRHIQALYFQDQRVRQR